MLRDQKKCKNQANSLILVFHLLFSCSILYFYLQIYLLLYQEMIYSYKQQRICINSGIFIKCSVYCSSQHVLHCAIELILRLCYFSLICNVILQLPTYAYIHLANTPVVVAGEFTLLEIIDLTFRAIQECRAMKFLKLFTKLK